MSFFLRHRSHERERMDLETLDPVAASSILGTLETVNARLGGVRATLWHVERFSKSWKPGEIIRFIDWGTGGADIPRALVDWGRAKGFNFEIVGVDSNPAVIEYAITRCQTYPEIRILAVDLTESSSFLGEQFDYAVSSLTLHHLDDQEIMQLLRRSDALARRGMIMNDLRRSRRAWLWIWLLTRLGRAHEIVQNDAPLSVERAFKPDELYTLAQRAGLHYLQVHSHFGYRLTLAGEKTR